MLLKNKLLLQAFFRIAFALLFVLCLVRVYEYFAIASHLFVDKPYRFELAGLAYDVWLWFQYSFVMFSLFALCWWLHRRLAVGVLHVVNIIFLLDYIALLITFSERTTPFDHEFFTRNGADSFETVKQMLTSGMRVYLPLLIYLPLYFLVYFLVTRRMVFSKTLSIAIGALAVLSMMLVNYSNPSPAWFRQTAAYYLTSNKMSYWLHDSYNYLVHGKSVRLTDKELQKEIAFYQQQHPFEYTSTEYPLLHKNNEPDVLGSFFNLGDSPPNLVILVVEGLSSDFSGANAYAGSFTPFLDSLSGQSLVWDNFLSTAPATFAAQPAILSSVPYGKRGFSIMNVMPDHLSLVKILRRNGYYTNFMIGFNPDFDNMGGYVRLQGTDFLLSHYGTQYKQMGVGEEGWSMGYPDDALYSRSFEVLDSVHRTPYLSVYHTGTTHMPYLFEQKPLYEKLFDKKLMTMNVPASIKRTLRATKSVLTTFMFSDDCIKKFLGEYQKRPEYSNTIFFITGDHHIGSFPSTDKIDDYRVPFIVYSPMLKRPQRFHSVNSHNNITPTILALLQHNYHLQWQPSEVHWLAGVMDTAAQFRNTQSMAFMAWSRDINDYLYKNYFLSGDELYQLTPNLVQEPIEDDVLKQTLLRLRENFKNINRYVCGNNKVYPPEKSIMPGEKELLWSYTDTAAKMVHHKDNDTSIAPEFIVPKDYKYLYVETTADVDLPSEENSPVIRFAFIDEKNYQHQYIYWAEHDLVALTKGDFVPKQWNTLTSNDMFTLDDYKKIKDLNFEVAFYTEYPPVNVRLRRLTINIYGIKQSQK